jgi:hypothetical protein
MHGRGFKQGGCSAAAIGCALTTSKHDAIPMTISGSSGPLVLSAPLADIWHVRGPDFNGLLLRHSCFSSPDGWRLGGPQPNVVQDTRLTANHQPV